MSGATVNLTPEQQELLDSGLRMLAHMIAETHLRRTALKKMSGKVTPAETPRRTEHLQGIPENPQVKTNRELP